MNPEQIKKEIMALKRDMKIKQKDVSIFDRIDMYEEIFASEEFKAYKKAITECDEKSALDIYETIPEDRKEIFLRLMDYEVNYFDKLNDERMEC